MAWRLVNAHRWLAEGWAKSPVSWVRKVNRTAEKSSRSRDRREPRHGEGDPQQARWMITGPTRVTPSPPGWYLTPLRLKKLKNHVELLPRVDSIRLRLLRVGKSPVLIRSWSGSDLTEAFPEMLKCEAAQILKCPDFSCRRNRFRIDSIDSWICDSGPEGVLRDALASAAIVPCGAPWGGRWQLAFPALMGKLLELNWWNWPTTARLYRTSLWTRAALTHHL